MSITLQVRSAGEHRYVSWITDVLLTVNLEERFEEDDNGLEACEALDNINSWLEKLGHGKLDNLSPHIQSSRHMIQCYVYGGAFNNYHWKNDEFVSLVLSQKWERPDSVMLLTKVAGEDIFTVHKIT